MNGLGALRCRTNPAAGAPLELLEDFLAMGAERGDETIDQPFPDPPGVKRNPIYGALVYAATLWKWARRDAGVKSEKIGQWAISFAAPMSPAAHSAAMVAALPFWVKFKKNRMNAGKVR